MQRYTKQTIVQVLHLLQKDPSRVSVPSMPLDSVYSPCETSWISHKTKPPCCQPASLHSASWSCYSAAPWLKNCSVITDVAYVLTGWCGFCSQTLLLDQARLQEVQAQVNQLTIIAAVLLVTSGVCGSTLFDSPGFIARLKLVTKVLLEGLSSIRWVIYIFFSIRRRVRMQVLVDGTCRMSCRNLLLQQKRASEIQIAARPTARSGGKPASTLSWELTL